MTTKVDNAASEENKVCEEELSEETGAGAEETGAGAEPEAEAGAGTGQDAEGGDTAGEGEAGAGAEEAGDNSGDETPKESEPEEEDEDLKTKHLRLMADFQNYKRRAEEAKTMSYSHGKEDLLTDLLPIIDNFERALESEGE